MVTLTWLRGLLSHRRGRILSTALGVAVGVALIASIGTFLSATTSKMTSRASAGVSVDWQVQAAKGAEPARLLAQVKQFAGVTAAQTVAIADTTGLSATAGGSTQHTGPGKVIGLPAGYATTFPGALRGLSGTGSGVLLAQQTAANLHAKPGDTVRIGRAGLPAASVRVDGVVDLPQADSFFQQVGAPVGAQPQAPPDNVILLPQGTFNRLEAPVAKLRPDLVVTQIHAALSVRCPVPPAPPTPRSPATHATWRPSSPAPDWSATTSAPPSTRHARTRSTPNCCSSSSASPARSSPHCSPPRSHPPARPAADATPRCCAHAAPPPVVW